MTVVLFRWLVFLHVLSALTFYMAHGTSVAMVFRIRKETDFGRMRAMLDLSGSTLMFMGISFAVMGLTGLILPFLVHLWDRIYIWLSIVLLIVVVVYMVMFSSRQYGQLRRLLGSPYMEGGKPKPAEPPASKEAVAAQLAQINVVGLVIVGYIIPGFVLWMMIFKPF